MANDSLAQAVRPEALSEEDYEAFVRALSETARGRAFLAEHARRSRSDESAVLLTSVQRLEGLVRSQTDAPPPEPVGPHPFDDVRDLLVTIRDKQDAFDPGALTAQIGTLAEMIQGVHQRIDTLSVLVPVPQVPEAKPTESTALPVVEPEPIVDEAAAAEAPAAVQAEAAVAAETASEPIAETASEALAEPEAVAGSAAPVLPDVSPPDVAIAAAESDDETATTAEIPEVTWDAAERDAKPADAAPAPGLAITALIETLAVPDTEDAPPEPRVIKAGTIPPPAPFAGEDFSGSKRALTILPPVDPLADIKALSEEERLALFT